MNRNQNTLSEGTILYGKQNSYKVLNMLGHGTFGVTYLAEICSKKKAGSKVCLKEFFVQGACSRDESGSVSYSSETIPVERCMEEFVAEAKNLIELNHPNIVKAHDLFEANGTCYYVMDYIEGENLNSYLNHTTLSVEEATKIITKIAYGLSYMHESQHMLHLDLKPGNVMRRASDGQIILIDFGLSRFFTEDGTPEDGIAIGGGTRGYSPVEQTHYAGRNSDFKATIDVYALGATFYKLITGETPLPAMEYKGQPELLTGKLRGCGVPEKIIGIVAKSMNPASHERYQSVMSFIYELNADERKRRNKGCRNSVLGLMGVIVLVVLSFVLYNKWKTAKEDYYNGMDDYAFEMKEFNQGANHYGEQEYYKFFTDGTGLYLFIAWHDPSECVGECDLTARTDTMTFKYTVRGNTISYPRGTMGDYGGEQDCVTVDPVNHTFGLDEETDNRYIDVEKVNWDKVNEILNR